MTVRTSKTIVLVISFLLSVLLTIGSGTFFRVFSESAVAECVEIEITLLSPITYTTKCKPEQLQTEAEAINALVRHIPQTAYDAFIMDRPLSFLWMDLPNSPTAIRFSGDVHTSGTNYLYTITGLTHYVTPLAIFTDPDGMTKQLTERIGAFAPTGDTLYDKVKAIHDYVCRLATYSYDGDYVYTAYGALIDRKAVCEGYAEAFKLLCDANGIDCVLISGTADNGNIVENHLWNYVRMDDGYWYAVDTTWDDGNTVSDRYFLVGSETVVVHNTATGNEIRFGENHSPDGDINNTGLKVFAFPDLSPDAYLVNNPDGKAADSYAAEEADGYFYHQLDPEQKNFYDILLTVLPPVGPGTAPTPADTDDLTETTDPTTTVESTAEESIAVSTVPPEDTDETSTSAETNEPVSEPPPTEPTTTERPPITTVTTETVPEPPPTVPPATEEPITESCDTAPITTEAPITETQDTEPPPTVKPTEDTTEPPVLSTTDTAAIPATEPVTTAPQILPTITLPPLVTTPPDPASPSPNPYETLTTVLHIIVIVLALIALFLIIILTFMRICRKEKDSENNSR